MPEALIQPQGDVQLNPQSPFAMAAHALVSGASDINLATGAPFDRVGSFETEITAVGKAHSFRRNGWFIGPPVDMGTQPFVEFCYGYISDQKGVSGNGGGDENQFTFLTGSDNNTSAIIARFGQNKSQFGTENWGALFQWDGSWVSAGQPPPSTGPVMLMSVFTEQGASLWANGVKIVSSDTGYTATNRGTSRFMVGAFVEADFWRSSGDLVLAGRAIVKLSDEQLASLGQNPMSVFATPSAEDEPAPVADTLLSGAALGQASSTGALSTSIRLTASAAAVSSAVGTLTTSVRMVSAASGNATGAGTLSTSILLAGAATAQAGAAGTLGAGGATLAGAAGVVATAGAALSTSITLSGAAQGRATSTGAVITAMRMAGAGSAQATMGAALGTAITLSGAASCNATAAGAFAGGGALLAGAALVQVNGTGSLVTSILLSGTAQASASAASTLGAPAAQLSGAAACAASAAGTLLTTIRMAGLASATVAAAGALGVRGSRVDAAKIPSSRTVRFGGGSRMVVFGGGTRVVVFGGGTRVVVFDVPSIEQESTMANADKPYFKDGKWWVDKDPDEKSYYVADITQELTDRATTAESVEVVVGGVTVLEGPEIQGNLVVVKLEGMDEADDAENFWTARVTCANTERFDRTTWLNRVDN